jgi:hypothetical protein
MNPETGGRTALRPLRHLRPLQLWPAADRRQLLGVFTDIDDTLTTHGAITPDALAALHALQGAGLAVIAITGRPIGWCAPFASTWPVDAMVAENGAVAFVRVGESGVGVEMFSTRSRRSMRDNIPASVLSPPGNNMRPQMSSRIKRGAVAPRIWVKPSAAISAHRERFAAPILAAWVRMRSN